MKKCATQQAVITPLCQPTALRFCTLAPFDDMCRNKNQKNRSVTSFYISAFIWTCTLMYMRAYGAWAPKAALATTTAATRHASHLALWPTVSECLAWKTCHAKMAATNWKLKYHTSAVFQKKLQIGLSGEFMQSTDTTVPQSWQRLHEPPVS